MIGTRWLHNIKNRMLTIINGGPLVDHACFVP